MRPPSPLLSLLINFLLGASWAFALIGASTLFFSFLDIGLIYAIFGAILGALPFFMFILFLEYFIMRQEKLEELKKHTRLLQELVELHKKS
jgi:predicted membrane protein